MTKRINSRDKGCRGEREWAKFLRERGFTDARRGQQHAGGPDSPDVVGGIPGTHAEAKRVEEFSDAMLRKWLDKVAGEAPDGALPYVAHRRNRQAWRVTIGLASLANLVNHITQTPAAYWVAPSGDVPVTMLAKDFVGMFEPLKED